MSSIINIAAYQFAPLADLKPLRDRLLAQCNAWGLKGTILLSAEGVNLFVAGEREMVERLLVELRGIAGLETLEPKLSVSSHQPFHRMLVKVKKEIIAFGVEGIDPARRPAPKLSARELKQWLDEERPLTLLDTRNEYEVKVGTFRNAISIGLNHFREFPQASAQLPAELKQRPLVMFCTGGIRCEKAGPYLEREGFEQVFQLDGGILKYFEECGDAHFEGECFVFDRRVGLDADLGETESEQCYACLTPLTAEDQRDARFVKGISCPYCFVTSEEQTARALEARQLALHKATHPLPGSQPYDNFRPIDVPEKFHGQPLIDFLTGILLHVPRNLWDELFAAGQMLDSSRQPVTPDRIVQAGERYLHWMPAASEPDVSSDIRIVYEDEAIIVLHKPAPLPLHPSGQYNRNTLQSILQIVYHPQKPRPAHRLDANTAGLVIFSRTRHFAGLVQSQFERGEVEKVYLARVQGHPPEDSFVCESSISERVERYGARTIDEDHGQPSLTEFRVLTRLEDGTSLVEARPITGRTHQIRLHLWQLGWPVVGDPLYLPGNRYGDQQTLGLADPPLCLLSQRIAITHPISRERLSFAAPLPEWAKV